MKHIKLPWDKKIDKIVQDVRTIDFREDVDIYTSIINQVTIEEHTESTYVIQIQSKDGKDIALLSAGFSTRYNGFTRVVVEVLNRKWEDEIAKDVAYQLSHTILDNDIASYAVYDREELSFNGQKTTNGNTISIQRVVIPIDDEIDTISITYEYDVNPEEVTDVTISTTKPDILSEQYNCGVNISIDYNEYSPIKIENIINKEIVLNSLSVLNITKNGEEDAVFLFAEKKDLNGCQTYEHFTINSGWSSESCKQSVAMECEQNTQEKQMTVKLISAICESENETEDFEALLMKYKEIYSLANLSIPDVEQLRNEKEIILIDSDDYQLNDKNCKISMTVNYYGVIVVTTTLQFVNE